MNEMWKSMTGTVQVHITTADMAQTLSTVAKSGVILSDVKFLDDLSFSASIQRENYRKLKNYVEKNGQTVKILRRKGLYWETKRVLKRPVLALGFLVVIFLCLFIPTRIFFVKVEGNHAVPTNFILEKAEACGIDFGASRRDVRSEKVKNAMLGMVPDLQWVGITTKGCVATVSVREREEITFQPKEGNRVGSIVAIRDGIIEECTVLRGTPLCQTGQAVKAGQTLVSGYTDCGISIRATLAEAEVYARTQRENTFITPDCLQRRGRIYEKQRYYSIGIGKKLIKLYKTSGISDTRCVKMYSEKYVHLPGGFRLPITLICEERIFCETLAPAQEEDYSWLETCAADYLRSQMTAGTILSSETALERTEGACILSGKYACREMIGQIKSEEIVSSDSKNG